MSVAVPVISVIDTSTVAFLRHSPAASPDAAAVRDRRGFTERFGADDGDSYLAAAVSGHFANGGGLCYVVTMATEDLRDGTGLDTLERLDDVRIVVVPDLWRVAEDAPLIAAAVGGHCARNGNRMALLHTAQGLAPGDAASLPDTLGLDDAARQFTAVYYPWLTIRGDDGTDRTMPPCGHVAGVWGKVDAARGVHRAPANEALAGVVSLERALTDGEQGPLDDAGVNCLRAFAGQGLRVWGARTLSGEPEWRYINVRRLVSHLQDSIRLGTAWTVFERNEEPLWSSIRESVEAFLTARWQSGALLGNTPDEAFFVVCDESNNPRESIAEGKVVCDVGVAAMRPAEFVVFQVVHAMSP